MTSCGRRSFRKNMHKHSSNLFYYFTLIFIEWMLLSLETAELNMSPEIQHFQDFKVIFSPLR